MNEIVEMAQRLGKAIADSQAAQRLRAAKHEFDQHKDLSELLKAYRQQADKIGQLEQEQKPVEVMDKRKLQEFQDKLVAAEPFKQLTAAQVEYLDMMHKVNEAIRRQLAEIED